MQVTYRHGILTSLDNRRYRSGVLYSERHPPSAARAGVSAPMRTVSRFCRGHRIRAVQLGYTWHASVHGHTGSIVTHIEGTSLTDTVAQA